MRQYEDILHALQSLQSLSIADGLNQLHDILCQQPGPDFPFSYLYVAKSSKCESSTFVSQNVFAPDCSEETYALPFVNYFIQFIDNNTEKAHLSNLCILENNENYIKLRYTSSGEVSDLKCNAKSRIAFINFKDDDAFISQIRWASDNEENTSQCKPEAAITGTTISRTDEVDKKYEETRKELSQIRSVLAQREQRLFQLQQQISYLDSTLQVKSKSIDSLNSEYKKSLRQTQESESKRMDALLQLESTRESLSESQKEFTSYVSLISREIESDLNTLDIHISDLGQKYLNSLGYFMRFGRHKTLFAGLNYGVIQAPFQLEQQGLSSTDPIKQSFKTPDIMRNFGVSLYYTVGLFFSNIRINSNSSPEISYSIFDIDKAKETLFLQGIDFTDLSYVRSHHNLNTFNFGLNLHSQFNEVPILQAIYLQIGVSSIKGEVWDYYSGDFYPLFLKDTESNLYSIDTRYVSKTGGIFGLAFVMPHFQLELGYNSLYSDYYLNAGLNYPIKDINLGLFRNNRHSTSKPHDHKQTEDIRVEIEEINIRLKETRNRANKIAKKWN